MPKFTWTHRTKSCLEYMKLKSPLDILQESVDMSLSKFNIQTLESITVASVDRGLSAFDFLSVCYTLFFVSPCAE